MNTKNQSQPEENLSASIPTLQTRSPSHDSEEVDVEQANEHAEIKSIITPDTIVPSHKDQTASDLASIIVNTFAWSIKLSFLVSILHFGIVYASVDSENGKEYPSINESMEIFKTVSAVMSGPIGFVFGFYFRENNR